MNKYQKSLNNLCVNCERHINEIKTPIREGEVSNANCGHRLCPWRHIDNSYCDDYETLQELIDELEEYKKYIPNLEELYKWCKGDYLQREGMNLKSQALKESETINEN